MAKGNGTYSALGSNSMTGSRTDDEASSGICSFTIAPPIEMPAPVVHVHVPEAPPPVINVRVPETETNVEFNIPKWPEWPDWPAMPAPVVNVTFTPDMTLFAELSSKKISLAPDLFTRVVSVISCLALLSIPILFVINYLHHQN